MSFANIDILSQLQNNQSLEYQWPEILPLPKFIPEAPRMSVEMAIAMLPAAMLNWIHDFANRAQVPIESAAVTGIGTLASVIGRKVGIYPKRNDSFWVPCVFWTAIIARPGERKSSIISFSQKPLDHLEENATRTHKETLASGLAKKEILKARIEEMKEKIKNVLKGKGKEPIDFLEVELKELLEEEEEMPLERRYRTNDATVEKLGELLRGNPQGILNVRDELIGWMKNFEKPGREGDRAFFLEGWDATGAPFSVDRIGRKRVVVDSLCIHVMGGIQPGKMEEYVRSATLGGAGDDGFLQRFQLMVYPEPQESVDWVDEKPDKAAFDRIKSIFTWLDQMQPERHENQIYGVRFSDAAQVIYQEWALNLERRFRLGEDEHPAFVSHLSKYLRLMPALSLLFHLVDCASKGVLSNEVSDIFAEMAIKWCDFLEAHARKVYAIVERQEIRHAEALKRRIAKGDVQDGMSIRDIANRCWAPFGGDAELIRKAITGVLEPHGYCRLEFVKAHTGRPSEVIRINPKFKRDCNA